MARHLQLPDNLTPENPPRMAPQWLSETHDSQTAINSALVDKPQGPGAKFTPWGAEDKNGQKQDKQERVWRAEEKPLEQRNWTPQQDRFSQPQQERFAPQGRPRPAQPQEAFTAKPGFGPDRWRSDGEGRWGHNSHAEGTQPPWDQSPARNLPQDSGFMQADNWNRQRQQRLTPPGPGPAGPDAGRWGSSHGWGNEEHYPPGPPRGNNWEAGGHAGRFTDPSTGLGRGKGFGNFGRGRGLAKEPLAPGTFVAGRWHPAPAADEGPAEAAPTQTRLEDIIVPPLGTGPQRHKYTVEQMLSVYASVAEPGQPKMPKGVTDEDENLFSGETYHHLLGILDTLARDMITAFATPAERRLATRLHGLLESSQPAPAPRSEPEPAAQKEPPAASPELTTSGAAQSRDPLVPGLDGVSPFSAAANQARAASEAPVPVSQPLLPGPAKPETEWFYQDPSGQIQGPYSQSSIQEWYDSGFFPLDLPVSSTRNPPHFRHLKDLLEEWKQPAKQPEPPLPVPAPEPQASLSTRPSAMQSRHIAAGTAGSARLDAAESGLDAPQQGAFVRGAFPPDRPGSHPYLDSQLQQTELQQLQAQLQQARVQQPRQEPALQYGLPQDPFQRGLDHGRQLLNGTPQQQLQPHQGQGQGQLLQAFASQSSALPPDPIVGPLSSLSMSRTGSAANLAPIGPGLGHRAPYNPPQASQPPYQPQGHNLVPELHAEFLPHYGRQNLLHADRAPSHEPHLGLPYSSPSFADNSFSHALPGHQQQQRQQGYDPNIRPLGQSISLNHWIQQPSQIPHQADSRGGEPQLATDVQKLGPLPSSIAPVGPPPRRVTPAPSAELPVEDEASFQKVDRSKRKEQWPGGSLQEEIARNNRQNAQPRKVSGPPPAPPRREEPDPTYEDWYRPPTLAQAAGLREPAPQEPEPLMPWAVTSSGGPAQKSLVDIQREEAIRAKEKEEREAAQASAVKSAAPNLTSTSWGKAAHRIMPPAPAQVTSLAEIQEQERRQARSVQRQPVTAPPAAPVKQPTWGSGPAPKLISSRSQQVSSADLEGGPPSHRQSGSRKAAAVAAPAQEPEDELFWDYGPPARQANGTTSSAAAKQNGARPVAVSAKPAPPAGPKPAAPAPEKVQPAAPEPEMELLLSPEFDSWCKAKLRELRGDDDMTLMHFLMTVSSNAEVAEYMTEILGRTAGVSAFANEFIKRKLAEQSGKKGGGRNRKSAAAQSPAAGKGAVGVAPVSVGGATGWTKLPKKKIKAKKVDAALLGFGTGTDYSQLEKLQD